MSDVTHEGDPALHTITLMLQVDALDGEVRKLRMWILIQGLLLLSLTVIVISLLRSIP